MYLQKELDELNKFIKNEDQTNLEVSEKGIYWHIDHSLKVIQGVIKLLSESDPSTYKNKFNLAQFYIFKRRSIPRGAGKAPKSVTTTEQVLKEDLVSRLIKVNSVLDKLGDISKNHYFDHYRFGHLNKIKALKFLKIHTQHHLKIMCDIKK